MIMAGDIITINYDKYIDFPGNPWNGHFVTSHKNLIVTRSESNNGNMLAKDSKGHVYHVNRMQVIRLIPLDKRLDMFA